MTKYRIYILSAALILIPTLVIAEETVGGADTVIATAQKIAEEVTTPEQLTPTEPSLPVLETPVVSDLPDATVAPIDVPPAPIVETQVVEAPAVFTEAIPTDNLEFISGEISSTDETTQSVTVKLYGETESGTSDKTLKVTVDGTTDITDGEQDRDLKSLAAGTEVDVEYDPATNKATYIFVY